MNNTVKTDVDLIHINGGEGVVPEYGYARLEDKFDVDHLNEQVEKKVVSVSNGNPYGLTNYKYSTLAQVHNDWNKTTVRARGLVVDPDGVIIARGFNKFFNFSQMESFGVDVNVDEPGVIMDKLDGSLGLAYKYNGQWVVSTAGSISSDQAIHATQVMNERYADTTYIPGRTMLVEIIYPENRIVTDYGDMDDLVLLGGADINGHWVHPDEFDFAGPRVELKRGTIRDALNAPVPEDLTEGFVIRLDSGLMVKIKYPKYLEVHKAKFNFSALRIWEALRNDNYSEFLTVLPDEFHDDANKIRDKIMSKFNDIDSKVRELFATVPQGDRKTKAIYINTEVDKTYRSLVMGMMAGRDVRDLIFKMFLRPGKDDQ